MKAGYTPAPGTIPWRAIELLKLHQPAGLPANVLAEKLGVELRMVKLTLGVPIKHWYVARELDGDRFVYRFIPPDERPKEKPKRKKRVKPEAVETEAVPFNLGMFLDGDLVILGAKVSDDGSVIVEKEQVTVLRDFLIRTAEPPKFVMEEESNG